MPLKKGNSKKTISSNIKELRQSNPDRALKQDVAIAFSEARKSKTKMKPKTKKDCK